MTSNEKLTFFAPTPRGVEELLAGELNELGALDVRPGRAGVSFAGPLETGYRACLWSRLANRILLFLDRLPASSSEELYDGIRSLPWEEYLEAEGSLAVDFNLSDSHITHSHFGALKVKDAVVDRFRDLYGVRPSVDRERPDLRINVYLFRNRARVSLDLSGESLHRRGYRETGHMAPLKENLAAAILQLAGWREIAAAGGSLLDPMCGSGTLVIEGALMAGDVAPGLLRDYFGFTGWKRHDPRLWEALVAEARERRIAGEAKIPAVIGWDHDPLAVKTAWTNVERAGLKGRVHIEKREMESARPPEGKPAGLVATNPPYGMRLGEEQRLTGLHARLGGVLRDHFPGWKSAVFTGNPRLGARIGLEPLQSTSLFNGPIECRLLIFQPSATLSEARSGRIGAQFSEGAEMFANRLRKNLRTTGRWARREGVDCFRLYDADLPEYAVAVDIYGDGEETWVHLQEYQAPKTVDAARAEERLREALAVVPDVLDVAPEEVFFKVRRRQKGKNQYDKMAQSGRFHEVREGECRFLVNFTDYLDTGLFLDHRATRQLIGELARDRRFLNLFGYTGTATVHAAMGGAFATTTVDMSKTYLEWARRNLALNGFGGRDHQLVQADCLAWLEEASRRGRSRFGLIFLDPPTFSTSKRMEKTFDIQRDHVDLIRKAADLLEPDGILIFSTNFRQFRIDSEALSDLRMEEISRSTIPRDFKRRPNIHRCWEIRHS